MFIDYAKIYVKAGKGGDGAVAFRREKYVPKGGPAGGNGGKGGDVIFVADSNLGTLLDFKYNRKYMAEDGQPGGNSLKDGRNGKDIIIKVPVGTIIKDEESGKVLCDLNENGKQYVAAKGGKGGKGNSNFATPTNQTPRYAEKGKPGEEKNIILELKLIADVGLVGFPNAGKSTLISTVSAARPKIADYPFTTLEPNLGIVRYKEYDSFTIADIPGIIEGAHEGKGLGLKFLRHIERTKILLIMVEAISEDYQRDFNILLNELNNYSKILAGKKKIFGISKADLLTHDQIEKVKSLTLNNHNEKIIVFSAVSGYGMDELLDTLWTELKD
ncbi:GTPase ObgE [Melioribacter roseus P3M-2]|uniref:GTPase Obg n=1 Tax=Melioribacter roseus (strain DSM 23840 / JCM 17771 / VKM B-2668 / P3M-2) TaxID=1191523 RepID=I6ZXB2_MELRP|nr:GTPase ObgE [Melioribacter roseus]AFN73698.1 GTPase ObgE [Melioribacter roseus P3M-2]